MKNLLVITILALNLTACLGGGDSGSDSAPKARIIDNEDVAPVTTTTLAPAAPTTTTTQAPSPTTTLAPQVYTFGGGQGTITQPYLLQNATDVDHIRDFPAAYFSLNNTIDMSSISNFTPIPNFSGVIYGSNTYYIYHLKINLASTANAAFIQNLSGTLTGLELRSANVKGQAFAAVLVGSLSAAGFLSNCRISGTVTSPSGGNGYNTGVGNPAYVTKSAGSSVSFYWVESPISVQFNGNTVNSIQ